MENNPFMFQTTNQLWFMLNIPNKTGGFVHQRSHRAPPWSSRDEKLHPRSINLPSIYYTLW